MAIQYHMRGYNTTAPGAVGYVDWVVNNEPDTNATFIPSPFVSGNISKITVNKVIPDANLQQLIYPPGAISEGSDYTGGVVITTGADGYETVLSSTNSDGITIKGLDIIANPFTINGLSISGSGADIISFTSGTPTLIASYDGYINRLSGTVSAVTLPAAVFRQSLVVELIGLGDIVITRAGSDTINGTTTYTVPGATDPLRTLVRFTCDATGQWTCGGFLVGSTGFAFPASASVISISQPQDPSTIGAQLTLRAQQGFAGSIGGKLGLGSGKGGTPGTNLGGAIELYAGATVSDALPDVGILDEPGGTQYLSLKRVAGPTFEIWSGANNSANASLKLAGLNIEIASTTGIINILPTTNLNLGNGTGVINWLENTTVVATEKFDADGVCYKDFIAGVTGYELRHNTSRRFSVESLAARVEGPYITIESSDAAGYTAIISAGDIHFGPGAGKEILHKASNVTAWTEHNVVSGTSYFNWASTSTGFELKHDGYSRLAFTSDNVTLNTSTAGALIRQANAVSFKSEYCVTATTATATTTTIGTFTTASNSSYRVKTTFSAYNSTDNESASYIREAHFKNVAGTVTQTGSTGTLGTDYEDAAQTGLDVAIDFSGTAIRSRVVTDSTDTVKWRVVMEIWESAQ